MSLKIKEAYEIAKDFDKTVKKKVLAAKLWPDSNPSTQQVNMTNLFNGTTKRFTFEMIVIICNYLSCTPNYLFDLK